MINQEDHDQILRDPKATGDELRSIISELQELRDLWRNRAHAAEAWYREEYDVDPHGEGIDVVYPWDHVGDELDLRPRHTGDKDDQQTTGNI